MEANVSGALGELRKIWTYPVKSLRRIEHAEIAIAADGLEGDRCSALYVASPEHARTGKTYRGKEDNRLHVLAEPSDAQRAAEERGVRLEARNGERHFDAGTVSLILDRWVGEVEDGLGRGLDPLRWRPNLLVRAIVHPSEGDLAGSLVAIGGVVLRVLRPIKRCVTPTYDVETGESDPAVQRFVVERRDNLMGVYCDVERPGVVRVGDVANVVSG